MFKNKPEEGDRKYFNISCTNVPQELLDKTTARAHFRKFGNIVRIYLRPKSRSCQIEYATQESAELASFAANEYNGNVFEIVWGAEPLSKKKQPKKDPDPEWVPDDPEVLSELQAMGQLANQPRRKISRHSSGNSKEGNLANSKKEKRRWQADLLLKEKNIKRLSATPKKSRKLDQEKLTAEQIELLKIIRAPAFTIEEKYKVLDARDKLIRLHTKKQSDLSKAKVTIGTCPDMCPEKERLMREVQHQIAYYEQNANDKGMNPKLAVKQYSRSSADQEVPLPHELRPVKVLQLTMNYLMHKIMDLCDFASIAEWYHFVWDRTRSIRKDITQQELCCLGSVELVEQCARFHIHCSARLVNEEPSVFDQKINTENLTKCLQTLKYMYHDLKLKGIQCPNEPEFRAYIILLNLNDGNFMWEVQQLDTNIQKSGEIKFAIQVYSAIDKNNYVKFFKLVKETTYLNACILLRYFVQIRLKALKTILKSYSPRAPYTQFPLFELKNILAFEDIFSVIEFVEYYGLKINEEKTNVILDRKSFYSPEIPFALDRAVNIVESKRNRSVAETVYGGNLPPPLFDTHVPHDSFNSEGLIDSTDFLEDIKEADLENERLEKLEEENSEEKKVSKMEIDKAKKTASATGNIFAAKSVSEKENSQSKEESTVWPSTLPVNQPQDTKGFPVSNEKLNNPFVPPQNMFGQGTGLLSSSKSIFGSPIQKSKPFSFALDAQKGNVFGNQNVAAIKPNTFQNPPSFGSSADTSLAPPSFGSPGNTFQAPPSFGVPLRGFLAPPPSDSSSTGGFKFDLKLPEKKEKPEEDLALEDQSMDSLKAQRRDLYNQLEEQRVIVEQKKQKMEDELKKKQLEEENKRKLLEEKKQKEEEERRNKEEEDRLKERLLAELKRKREKEEEEKERKEQERKRKEEERKRKEEERKQREKIKMQEIANAVGKLMDDLLTNVEENLRQEKIQAIKQRIKNWKISLFFRKWKTKVETKKRKRKIVETSPVWISSRSVEQEASQLFTVTQQMTVENVKRYKMGKSIEFHPPLKPKIQQIDFLKISECLLKNFARNDTKVHKEIFWKMTVSLPDGRELKHGLPLIEEVLKDCFGWEEDKYGNTFLIKQTKVLTNSVTSLIEKRQGIRTLENNNNSILFIAKDANEMLISRIKESVRNFRKYVFVSVCVYLFEEPTEEQSKLLCDLLEKENHISDYIIATETFKPNNITSALNENVSLLAQHCSVPPNLMLNTLSNFLKDNLCSDLWNYVMSYGKWNNLYKKSLRNPNVVVNLYNEALDRLVQIVCSSENGEYPDFPEEFQEFINNKIPEVLPCDFKYFPKFWNKQQYTHLLSAQITSLKIPQYVGKWPPSNELELENDMLNYCSEIFPDNDKIFFKIMSVVLKEFDPEENFEKVGKLSWVKIIEVISTEKTNNLNCSLRNTEFYSKSIFNQLVVVFDPEDVRKFLREPWYYITNPLVSAEMKLIGRNIKQNYIKVKKRQREKESFVELDFDQTINSTLQMPVIDEADFSKNKASLCNLEFLINDLEESINIHKKINEKFQETVQSVLLDV